MVLKKLFLDLKVKKPFLLSFSVFLNKPLSFIKPSSKFNAPSFTKTSYLH